MLVLHHLRSPFIPQSDRVEEELRAYLYRLNPGICIQAMNQQVDRWFEAHPEHKRGTLTSGYRPFQRVTLDE